MGKIFCLMGKSSTGKDTIYKELLQNEELSLKRIVPYTTRPIRVGETEGVEYHFTDEEGYLPDDMSSDGCHLYGKYDVQWEHWIRNVLTSLRI